MRKKLVRKREEDQRIKSEGERRNGREKISSHPQ